MTASLGAEPHANGIAASRARWPLVVQAACLGTWLLVLLSGFANSLDLHHADEVMYQQVGWAVGRGDWSNLRGGAAPVTALLYAGLFAVCPDGVLHADVMFATVYVASGFACWFAMRGVLPGPAGLLVALVWAGAVPVLQFEERFVLPTVYLLGASLSLTALGCLFRGRAKLGLPLLAIAALNRSEITPWILGIGLVLLVLRPPRRRAGAWFAGVGIALAALQASDGTIRARAWLTFKQHYAHQEFLRSAAGDFADAFEVFEHPDPTIERVFGDAGSVAEAFAEAPRAVLAHVAANVADLPGGIAELAFGAYRYAPPLRWLWLGLLLVWVGGGLARGPRRWARDLGQRLRALPPFAVAALLAAPLTLIGPLVLAKPRSELLLPLFPIAGVAAGLLLAASGPRLGPRFARYLPIALPLALLAAAPWSPGPFPDAPERPRELRESLALCRAHVPPGSRVLGERGAQVAFLLSPQGRVEGVSERERPERALRERAALATLLAQTEPTHVVFLPILAWAFRPARGFAELLDREPGALGREYRSGGGVILIELGPPAADPAYRVAGPRLRVAAHGAPPAGGITVICEGAEPQARVALILARLDGVFRGVPLTEAVADAAGRATLPVAIPPELTGARIELRAVVLSAAGQLAITAKVEHGG